MKKLLFIISILCLVTTVHSQTLLDTAVNFTVKDTYGNNFDLFEKLDEGKMVVIDFFSVT
jgi:hypothetical protein